MLSFGTVFATPEVEIGDNVYVGPYSVATHQESGDTFSYCVWTESVDISLPVAQRVIAWVSAHRTRLSF